ncbi:MAG: two-component sensor histidine kinase [Cereibacter sphaeroides]|uniref:histidine kinase n=1 Tax=Cereibacter sphaeroides TaxID=1063 RepID=A0A2W5TYI8_CERSP|nr:MAG: two-component sensor histidine kinase [Cereibacter sphaeroides]
MPRARWLRSTPFRLLLSFSLLTLTNIVLAFLAAWLLIGSELSIVEDRQINEIIEAADRALANVDLTRTEKVAQALRAVVPNDGTYYVLTAPIGAVIAGNTEPVQMLAERADLPPSAFRADTDVEFRAIHKPVRGLDLLVARPQSALEEIQEVLLEVFTWSALIVLLAGIGGGAFFASRVKRRLDTISDALEQVGKGDLTIRIAQSGRRDDIDGLVERINQTVAQLEANVGALRQLSVDIAHDLRTPLNRLHIQLEEASRHLAAGHLPETEVDEALAQSEAIAAAFSALLRIAQIEAGARREQFRKVDLAEIAADAAEAYEGVAEDAGMTLVLQSSSPTTITGDRDLLLQATVNIIENAICHCPVGTRIHLKAMTIADGAVLSVTDNGPGIPVSEYDNVLRRHYRLERSRTTPGFGLGLSLVRAVADLHGAVLTLSDARPGLKVSMLFQSTC